MKDVLVPIDKAGRLVLPKNVRDELAINPGDLLRISIHGSEVTLHPNRQATGFVKRGRALVFSTGGADLLDNDTVETVRTFEREGSKTFISKGLLSQRPK
ncbi:MAG TPA: AbrB/MazE/SpoVT family DNA-binding domain-containing protein [Verrucomicrobiae bacterium]